MPRPEDRLRKNFKRREFGHAGNEAPVMDEAFLDKLQAFRERVGRPVRITSGRRTAARNARVGGVPDSEHLFGRAVDLQVDGMRPSALRRMAEEVGFTGIGIYKQHLHVDTGTRQKVWYKGVPTPTPARQPGGSTMGSQTTPPGPQSMLPAGPSFDPTEERIRRMNQTAVAMGLLPLKIDELAKLLDTYTPRQPIRGRGQPQPGPSVPPMPSGLQGGLA